MAALFQVDISGIHCIYRRADIVADINVLFSGLTK